MIVTYTAVDGYKIESTSTAAWLMSDTASTMISDQVTSNSPLKTLTANGTITTAVVASNSTTLAASGFSSSNYYSRAYDASFDPGTTGLTVKYWIKRNTISSAETIFQRDSSTTGQNYRSYMDATGVIYFNCDDGTTDRSVNSGSATYDDNDYHMVVATFDGTDINLYADGAYVSNATGSALNTLSNGTAVLRIGYRVNGTDSAFGGSICGFEIDIGNQWTAQQIKTKYNTEKVLFDQLELFSIVGNSITYEQSLLTSSIGHDISQYSQPTLDGAISGLTWYRKKQFSCTSVPFLRTSLPGALKFLKSTNNVTFTFDERGSSANSPQTDNPITVYKTSNNEQLSFANPHYQYSFSVREA